MSVLTLKVDEVVRTLSAESSNPFVVHDKEIDIVRFAINSGFADIVLDGQAALRVMYQRPGETEVRAKTLTYYDTDGLRNYYDWQLLSADLAKKGALTVALCILRTDSEVEEWHTIPYQIRVLDTIHTDDSDEADETITPTVAQRVAVLEAMIQRIASGAPIVVASTSAMIDTEQIYVLSTDGKWYYYDSSLEAWTAGGIYGAVATDTSLTQRGMPADAKTVGDAIETMDTALEQEVDYLESQKESSTSADLAISDEDGNVIVEFIDGGIKTKNFDSTHTPTNNEIDSLEREVNYLEQEVNYFELETDYLDFQKESSTSADLVISDEDGNAIAEFIDGGLKTKSFDSANVATSLDIDYLDSQKESSTSADLVISDEDGNAIVEFIDGGIKTKSFDSANVSTSLDIDYLDFQKESSTSADLVISDEDGNVIVEFANGGLKTKNFDSANSDSNAVKTVNNQYPDANGNVNVIAEINPEDVETVITDYMDSHPVVVSVAGMVSVDDYGAVGDGITDDTVYIQDAISHSNNVYFSAGKTYCVSSTINVNKGIVIRGGSGTKIKTIRDVNNDLHEVFSFNGTLKLDTTLTSNYTANGSRNTDNTGNKITLSDMTGVEIGDIVVIEATDQWYSYTRRGYHLGAVLEVVDIFNGHLYVNIPLPYDIENTASVSVKVYSAPSVVIEDIAFEGEIGVTEQTESATVSLVRLNNCKNSIVKGCHFSYARVCLILSQCVNATVTKCGFAKSKYSNTLSNDGYGIYIGSNNNTTISDCVALCAQHCITNGGDVPSFSIRIIRSQLMAECRQHAIGMHENIYDAVIEDCVIGGALFFGNTTVERCRFVTNKRIEYDPIGISYHGSHNPKFATLKILNCVFEDDLRISLSNPYMANPVQACDAVIDTVIIDGCKGGQLYCNASTSTYVRSNTVNRIYINEWVTPVQIKHNDEHQINKLLVKNSDFTGAVWLCDENGLYSERNINSLAVVNDFVSTV